jgi:hypothetical protein
VSNFLGRAIDHAQKWSSQDTWRYITSVIKCLAVSQRVNRTKSNKATPPRGSRFFVKRVWMKESSRRGRRFPAQQTMACHKYSAGTTSSLKYSRLREYYIAVRASCHAVVMSILKRGDPLGNPNFLFSCGLNSCSESSVGHFSLSLSGLESVNLNQRAPVISSQRPCGVRTARSKIPSQTAHLRTAAIGAA